MPVLASVSSSFVTKFNVQGEFSFSSPGEDNLQSRGESPDITPSIQNKLNEEIKPSGIEAILSPNPVKNSLQITLKQTGTKKASALWSA